MTETTTRDEMIGTLCSLGEFAHGGRVEQIADEWLDNDFGPDEAREWIESGYVFDAASARQLSDAGVEPSEAAQHFDGEYPEADGSLGYAFANNDISLERVLTLLGRTAVTDA